MDQNDRKAIEDLFEKLSTVEQRAPARDPEAEAFIAARIGAQPGAPYFMAQTIVVQERALIEAQARIEDLEARLREGPEAPAGGLFGRLFGGASAPPAPRPAAAPPGGGFLAGAAQTAMGVAGGVLLGNMIGSLFQGEAAAAEPPEEDPGFDEGGFDGDF